MFQQKQKSSLFYCGGRSTAQAVMQLLLTACHFAPHVVSGWFLRRQSLSSLFLYFIEQIIQIRSIDLESELCDLVSDVRFARFVIKYKSLLGTAALCWPAAPYTPERTLKSRSSFTKITIMLMIITTTIMIIYWPPIQSCSALRLRRDPMTSWSSTTPEAASSTSPRLWSPTVHTPATSWKWWLLTAIVSL